MKVKDMQGGSVLTAELAVNAGATCDACSRPIGRKAPVIVLGDDDAVMHIACFTQGVEDDLLRVQLTDD